MVQIDCSGSDCNFVYTTYSRKHVNRESTTGQTLLISMLVQLLVSEKLAKGHSAMERLFYLLWEKTVFAK